MTSESTEPSQTAAPSSAGFKLAEHAFNEAYAAQDQVRPHWKTVVESMRSMGDAELANRQQKVQRILRDDGATYHVYDKPISMRTWALDPIPFLLDSAEWREIENGLIERAELFNLILKDIYGPQELIKHKLIPAELLYTHPGFLRPCHGIDLPGEHHLIVHSVDMVRDEQGEMVVLGDRTQAPSGAGYALENRVVMGRVFPSLFRESHVHRLSNFFNTLRQTLNGLSRSNMPPQVVVLTPGAYNETHFEHAHLANYLGFPLVQGVDLTVRDGFVWMKTLSGLVRVDVILRRVDDAFCDPVELRANSQLGVPGLLEVVRRGNVALANPLGSGVLESPALLNYLPEISKALLGRELRLPTPTTLWCGDPNNLATVLQNFDHYVIKTTHRRGSSTSTIVAKLSEKKQAALKKAIQQRPLHFVAQEIKYPSILPGWDQDHFTQRPAVLRSFTIVGGSSYVTMPGGLTRAGAEADALVITNQTGSVSKDTWILSSEPKVIQDQPVRDVLAEKRAPMGADLTSRVVENMFWMGRYAERAETSLRLLRTVFVQLNSADQFSDGEFQPDEAYRQLLLAVTKVTATFPGFTAVEENLFQQPEQELMSVILDHQRMGSVRGNLQAMITSADEIKEMMSTDVLGIINDLRDELSRLPDSLSRAMQSAPEEALDPLVTHLLAISGVMHESVVRSVGWRFFEMGRRLERAVQSGILLRSTLVQTLPPEQQSMLLENVLISLESVMTYRRRYRARLDVSYGLELMLLDRNNPRSLIYQLSGLVEHAELLLEEETSPVMPQWSRLLLEAMTAIRGCDPSLLAITDTRQAETEATDQGEEKPLPRTLGQRKALEQLLARVQELLMSASDAIADRYFDHSDSPQSLVSDRWETDE